jgi:hypothetical protein
VGDVVVVVVVVVVDVVVDVDVVVGVVVSSAASVPARRTMLSTSSPTIRSRRMAPLVRPLCIVKSDNIQQIKIAKVLLF